MTIYACEIYFLICQSFNVGKDATSYLLKDAKLGPFTLIRLARWHRDGVYRGLLDWLPCVIVCWIMGGWSGALLVSAGCFFIRLSFYDVSFNKWSNLNPGFFGTTPKLDGFWIKIFGRQGAVKKAAAFLVLLIALQFLIHANH